MGLKLGSLFSGCGGLDLGAVGLLGGEVSWFVESDEEASAVFSCHHPRTRRVKDARTATALPHVDLVTGGFPCQDISHAGRKAGIAHGKHSSLGLDAVRLILEVEPGGLVLENSYHRWRSWMPELRRSLWQGGYASLPIRMSAAEAGAPHLRYRAFLLGWRVAADANGAALRLWAKRNAGRLPGKISRRWEAESKHAGSDGVPGFSPFWPAPPGISALDDEPSREVALAAQRLAGNAVVRRVGELATLALIQTINKET